MKTHTQFSFEDTRLSLASRVSRLALGVVLLVAPMTHSGVLGGLAVLPLLAIYPLLTGILGFGLIEALAVNRHRDHPQTWLTKATRAGLFLLGVGLVAFVMVSEVAPVWLALVAVFPILMAAVGSNLVSDVLVTRRSLQAVKNKLSPVAHADIFHMPMRGKAHEENEPQQAA